eukprot:CAMPEP_0175040036 /NCGR_PEP_ID=MMETSP0052_2-20121109/1001_1 /TAXON_ID=51329 ORGANISM="Polytomella parva, Strain SAG 63-3" /NCGR_SAMPLE_ID=MMETSP0052_2 /ASSEMBLY_ACC=CAM_ASM_000194 /LENGTH=30 /DNA_ID= /DNA_START= /DNA_END= /DNA_ORIENTATION=
MTSVKGACVGAAGVDTEEVPSTAAAAAAAA